MSGNDVPELATVPGVDWERGNDGCNFAGINGGVARLSASPYLLRAKISSTGGGSYSLVSVERFPACASNTVETWPLSQRGGCNTNASKVSM